MLMTRIGAKCARQAPGPLPLFVLVAGLLYGASPRVPQQPEILVTLGHTAAVNHVRYSPDGRLLATAGGDGAVKVWDVSTGNEVTRLVFSASSIAFNPDGQLLAHVLTITGLRQEMCQNIIRGQMVDPSAVTGDNTTLSVHMRRPSSLAPNGIPQASILTGPCPML